MAYTTPPSFSDGTILTASSLNILSDNDAYFESIEDIDLSEALSDCLHAAMNDKMRRRVGVFHKIDVFLLARFSLTTTHTLNLRDPYSRVASFPRKMHSRVKSP